MSSGGQAEDVLRASFLTYTARKSCGRPCDDISDAALTRQGRIRSIDFGNINNS
jgi:hypothetical protein